jgi:stringent starvation protein B
MHFDFGAVFQVGREFFECRVGLLLNLVAQASQELLIEDGRIAATVRFWGQAEAFTIAVKQTRDSAAVNRKG